MSGFFKDYKSCKNFKFQVSNRNDIAKVLRYFQNREFTPVPRDLLVEAK
jgi:DNA polymerase III delta prime subunit